jgi:enoyl-CoA hydratase
VNETRRETRPNRVYIAQNLLAESMELMRMIVSKPAGALGCAKIAVNQGRDSDLQKALELEISLISLCFATGDPKERMSVSAFLEKHPAKFIS